MNKPRLFVADPNPKFGLRPYMTPLTSLEAHRVLTSYAAHPHPDMPAYEYGDTHIRTRHPQLVREAALDYAATLTHEKDVLLAGRSDAVEAVAITPTKFSIQPIPALRCISRWLFRMSLDDLRVQGRKVNMDWGLLVPNEEIMKPLFTVYDSLVYKGPASEAGSNILCSLDPSTCVPDSMHVSSMTLPVQRLRELATNVMTDLDVFPGLEDLSNETAFHRICAQPIWEQEIDGRTYELTALVGGPGEIAITQPLTQSWDAGQMRILDYEPLGDTRVKTRIIEMAKAVIEHLELTYTYACIEFLFDEEDDALYVTEVNPRLGDDDHPSYPVVPHDELLSLFSFTQGFL